MPAPIALVDCNNFYASCERVFQPELRGKPVVVLSNNDGCCIARSDESKALGIEMGAPWHLNRERFARDGVIVRSSNYTLYGDMSARVMRVLANFTPELEVYSIDEAFLDLSGFEHRLEAHARALGAIVLQWTGIPVSVGIAPTKTLAKAANRTAKKDPTSGGVILLLTTAAQELALGRMELTDLWGVARRTAEKLIALGIATPLQLRDADPRFLRERFSVVLERTVHELRGTPCIEFEDVTPNRKSIVASRSFGRPVLRATEMAEAVATYTARAAEKMRRQGLTTANLIVFVETNRFRPDDPQHCASQAIQLPVATADTGKLTAAALRGLAPIWRTGFSFKKAGVMFLDLVPEPSEPLSATLQSPHGVAARQACRPCWSGGGPLAGRSRLPPRLATRRPRRSPPIAVPISDRPISHWATWVSLLRLCRSVDSGNPVRLIALGYKQTMMDGSTGHGW